MKNPRVIAMYLPQFHETVQNNKWWGKGFTEWTAVRSTIPYFEGHVQPKVPFNNYYYDLMNKSVMEWQVEVARKYGVDGFCFYHYYFNDGDKILEKPAENLLEWKDINIPFCFCWDSAPWVRSWSRLSPGSGGAWGEQTDKFALNCSKKTVLFDQQYGDKESWKNHFDYLLPFFRDERYIKVDGCPVFIFFSAKQIPCFISMVHYWQMLAKESGLQGLYIVASGAVKGIESCINAAVIHQPSIAFGKLSESKQVCVNNGVKCYDYDTMWQSIVEEPLESDIKTFYCGLVNYDDTPRRGANGSVIVGASKEIFYKRMKEVLRNSILKQKELLFINAWNEWGEGMYLEPDLENGYGYLEALNKAINEVKKEELIIDVVYENNFVGLKMETKLFKDKFEKYHYFYWILNRLLDQKFEEINYKTYLDAQNIHSIAIYGAAELGRHILNQLKRNGVQAIYAIDKAKTELKEVKVYHPEDDLPSADLVIITAFDYHIIYDMLLGKGFNKITPICQFLSDVEIFFENM